MKKDRLKLQDLRVHSFVTSLQKDLQQTVLGAGTQLNPCGIADRTIEPCRTMPIFNCGLAGSLELNGCQFESLQQACPD